MLFVQLSSIVLVGYFVTAHCILIPILIPILFKYHYTIRRRTYILYKRKKQTQFYYKTMSVFLITQFLYF